ncbi:S24 family peptidase [Enterococcus italicus]|uniref:LexA family protein n=1 Tax=Enterococcus italicus TaxID=246144 RepID=UPI003D9A54E9
MKVSTGIRLKQLMLEKGLKQIDVINRSKNLQKELGIKLGKSTLSQYVNDVQSPDQDRIYLLAKFFDVSEPWLMGFDVPKERVPDNERTAKNLLPVSKLVKIPILGDIACGDPITAEENIQGYRDEVADTLPTGDLFYLHCKGDSMAPTIPNNAYVLIRQQPNVEDGEIAAVLVNGDTEATLKRVKRQGNLVMLMPDNQSYDPYIVTPDNPARILGKAIKMSADL